MEHPHNSIHFLYLPHFAATFPEPGLVRYFEKGSKVCFHAVAAWAERSTFLQILLTSIPFFLSQSPMATIPPPLQTAISDVFFFFKVTELISNYSLKLEAETLQCRLLIFFFKPSSYVVGRMMAVGKSRQGKCEDTLPHC